jgi:hypothetical protein
MLSVLVEYKRGLPGSPSPVVPRLALIGGCPLWKNNSTRPNSARESSAAEARTCGTENTEFYDPAASARYTTLLSGLEQKTLQPLDNPFGTRLLPMS